MKLALIPQPHKLTMGNGFFKIPASRTIAISDSRLYSVAEQAKAIFKRYDVSAAIRKMTDPVRISLRNGLKPGGYRLTISTSALTLEAESPTAAFHGLQTLLQIASQSPAGRLPALRIDDWPDLQDRGVYYDVCRGRVPKLARLMEQVALLSHFKINQYQLYVEHTFHFRGHPDIGKGASPLTAEDMLVLDAWCREFQVNFVPSLASFGHMATVLKHPQYHHLAEDWGIGKYTHPEGKIWQNGFSLSPANPKTYSFLESLYSEFLPLFKSGRFNVCCDETWDLGWGQTYELCKKKGKGQVYLDHIKKLDRLSKKYGKKIMFWGDIIRHHPKLIKDIPKDVLVLDWGYAFNHPFDRIRDFRKAGLDFYACPGTSSWVSLFPRLYEAMANIHGFAMAAKKNKARGLLNTDWGDGGHYNFMEYSWHGYLFGAEQAWNVEADQKTFTARFCKLFFGTDDPALVRAIDTLGEVTHLNVDGYYQSVWQSVLFALPGNEIFGPKRKGSWICRNGKIRRGKIVLDAKLGHETLKRLDTVRRALAATAQKRRMDPHGVLPYWTFAVDTIALAAKKLTVLGQGGRNTRAARKALKLEMASLLRQFEKLWMARNRVSEIRVTQKRYRAAIRALGK